MPREERANFFDVGAEHNDNGPRGRCERGLDGPDDQRLFKLDKTHWRYVEILHLADAEQAKVDAVIPRDCQATNDALYDWATLRLRTPLVDRDGGKPCGMVVSEIDPRLTGVAVVASSLVRPAAPLTP